MSAAEYQGWTNYATWAVKLWLDNEQATYNDMIEIATSTTDSTVVVSDTYSYTRSRVYNLAQQISNYVTEMLENGTWYEQMPGMFRDLFEYALQSVNWDEIAAAYAEDNPL